MKKLKNIPSLRFPEFKEEWEKKKLGDIGDVKMCRRIFNDETLSEGDIPFFKIGSFGKVADAFITKHLFLEYREKFSYPKKGNVLISAAGTIGRLVIYNGEDAYYQDSNIVWIDNDETLVTDKYLYYILQLSKFKTEGGTIQRLYNSILKSTKFSCSTLKEQTKITSFLTAVDDKLQALKQKKTLLEQYKKGVMQKIFSQELRFKPTPSEISGDDTSTTLSAGNGNEYPDWEEKKLGEVANKKSSNISANKIEDNFGDYIIYGASGVLKKVDFFKEEDDYISIVKDGAGVGRLFYCKGKSSVLGTMEIIRPNEGIDTYYLYCLLSNIDFVKYVTGSTIPHIYFKDYSAEICGIPCLEEQTKIANFLSAIDDKINHCGVQIEKMEVWKKGLLQQMFC
jgi:type I restriction enzyme S subunit